MLQLSRKTLIIALSLITLSAHAEENERKPRKGFFFGAGLSGSSELNEVKKTYLGFQFRIGWGLTDQILLLVHSYINEYDPNGNRNVRVQGLEAAAEYMFFKDNQSTPYVLLGAGIGFDSYQPANNNIGFSVSTGFGYEFRIGRVFALQPELTFHFVGDDGNKYTMLNYGLTGSWYF